MERYRNRFDSYRRPRSAHRVINIAPTNHHRLSNAFYGCESSTPPSRIEPTPAPPRRPVYRSAYRASEDGDTDGLLLLCSMGISGIVSLVGSYEIAHNFIRPNFGGDANNPEGLALAAGLVGAYIGTVVLFYALGGGSETQR